MKSLNSQKFSSFTKDEADGAFMACTVPLAMPYSVNVLRRPLRKAGEIWFATGLNIVS
jgi:hypothetical protein